MPTPTAANDDGMKPVEAGDDNPVAVKLPENDGGEAQGVENQGEQGAGRDYVLLPPNMAGNKKLVSKCRETAVEQFQKFSQQASRIKLEENMKTADRMWRTTKLRNRTTASDQQEDTLSNVSSTSFYRAIQTQHANFCSLIFYGEDLPVKFEPVEGSDEFKNDAEAKRIAAEQNALLRYNWDQDGLQEKIEESLFFLRKYGLELVSVDWKYETAERVERVPVAWDEQGRPTVYVFTKAQRVVADWATFRRYDLKDAWFDCQIADSQNWNCLLLRDQITRPDLLRLGREGEYQNVGKVSDDNLYRGDTRIGSTVLSDRLDAADSQEEQETTGNYEWWRVLLCVPVTEGGKYDAKNAVPVWHEMIVIGDLEGGVCVQLRRLPYHLGLNFKLIHARRDDKGAVSLSDAELAECLYEEHTTTINEMIDNKTLRTRKPWVGERGNVLSRDLKFRGGNQVLWVKPGTGTTALREITVQDTTQTSIPFLDIIEDDLRKTLNFDKPVAGEALGARTTATEANNVALQAIKPVVQDASYMARQYLPFIAENMIELWRQFGDPRRAIMVTHNGITQELKPTELYGGYKTRVVSIGQFENDMMKRQTLNNFMQVALPVFAPIMGKQGLTNFAKDVTHFFKLPRPDAYFPPASNRDAVTAWSENITIMQRGVEDYPQTGEDHAVHIPIHENYLQNYLLLPDYEQDANRVRMLRLHIQMHNQLQAEEQGEAMQVAQQAGLMAAGGGNTGGPGMAARQPNGAPVRGQVPAVSEAQAQLSGENNGDVLGGVGGAAT